MEQAPRRLPSLVSSRGELYRVTSDDNPSKVVEVNYTQVNTPTLVPSTNYCSKFTLDSVGRIYDIERGECGEYISEETGFTSVTSTLSEDRSSDIILVLNEDDHLSILIYRLTVEDRYEVEGTVTRIMRIPTSTILPLFLIHHNNTWERLTLNDYTVDLPIEHNPIEYHPMQGETPDIDDIVEIRDGIIITSTKAYILTEGHPHFVIYIITPSTIAGIVRTNQAWNFITIDENLLFSSYLIAGGILTRKNSSVLRDIDQLHSIIGFVRIDRSDILLCRDGHNYYLTLYGYVDDGMIPSHIFAAQIPTMRKNPYTA